MRVVVRLANCCATVNRLVSHRANLSARTHLAAALFHLKSQRREPREPHLAPTAVAFLLFAQQFYYDALMMVLLPARRHKTHHIVQWSFLLRREDHCAERSQETDFVVLDLSPGVVH